MTTASSSGVDDSPQGREVGVLGLVLFIVSVIGLGFELWYLTGKAASLSIDFAALLTALPQTRQAISWQWAKALVVVAVLAGVVCMALFLYQHFLQKQEVEPQLDWSGSLDVGAHGDFTFSTDGYTKAKLDFSMDDAASDGAACVPDTFLDVSIGPQNNLRHLGRIGPGSSPEITVDLPGDSGRARISLTIFNAQKQQTHCPVNLRVTSVLLMKG